MPVRGRYRRQIRRRKCCFSPFECNFRDVSPGRNYSTLFRSTIADVTTTPNRNILHIGPYFLTRCRAHAMQEAQSHCDSNRNARNHGQKQRTYTESASNSNRVTQQPTERNAPAPNLQQPRPRHAETHAEAAGSANRKELLHLHCALRENCRRKNIDTERQRYG